MSYMFQVRRVVYPLIYSRALPCTPFACAAIACRPAVCRPAPRLAAYAVLSARQSASAFNQPLSFGTSNVRSMSYMFYVRSVHALRTTQPPARTSLGIVCPPFGSAVRVSVQPAAEF